MTVIAEIEVNVREFSGWNEPQFPSGYWSAGGQVLGDASGGSMGIQVNFSRATSLRNSQFYSLEQFSAWQQVGTLDNAHLSFANFDLGRGSGIERKFSVVFIATQAGFSPIQGSDITALRGLFLGRQFDPNTTTSMSLLMDNNNTVFVNLRAEGYIWDARSVAVAGGPQRPLTGLYRD